MHRRDFGDSQQRVAGDPDQGRVPEADGGTVGGRERGDLFDFPPPQPVNLPPDALRASLAAYPA